MFAGGNCFTMELIDLAEISFKPSLFRNQSQRLGTLKCPAVSGDGFVKSKQPFRFMRRAPGVIQTALVVPSLNVVIRKSLNRTLTVTLKTFSRQPVQTSATNWVNFFVKHFTNLVVREGKRLITAGRNQLSIDRFVQRIQQRILR